MNKFEANPELSTLPNSVGASLPSFPNSALDRLLPWAFEEDEGQGDITSLATIDAKAKGKAILLVKEPGVLAGLPLVEQVFRFRGYQPTLTWHSQEGDWVKAGTKVMTLEAPLQALLVCERILLNLLQRCCGIATATHEHVQALAGSGTRLLDTRKTLPGYRLLDKYSVALGGGTNHRIGLYDQVLVKDNHATACGSVRSAVDRVQEKYEKKYLVEAEVQSLAELESLLDAPVDIVLLDNMDNATLVKAIALVRARAPKIKLEASGNMNLDRLQELRLLGLDFISIGAITHSVRALDISMKITSEEKPKSSQALP